MKESITMIESKKKIDVLSNETLEKILDKHESEFTEIQEKAGEIKKKLRIICEKM